MICGTPTCPSSSTDTEERSWSELGICLNNVLRTAHQSLLKPSICCMPSLKRILGWHGTPWQCMIELHKLCYRRSSMRCLMCT
ncbi:hypothetical protein DPMN_146450 [Dreissena polymorpha]|uniref:Uncharacterized protein n=1 Tax=Dreissena polymorpha TaxID=45954 RepID=A0A9D4J238_DREPO|nr:hypothetical protein DPMN_146450 [Dreissena polymorpha]